MRECAYKAGLLNTLNSAHLEFTTERAYNELIVLFIHRLELN